jgi:hypothetical protein
MPCDTFISYSRKDRYWADLIYSELTQHGVSVFMDTQSIVSGDLWLEQIESEIISAKKFLILVGKEGIQRWTRAELTIALNHHLEVSGAKYSIHPILLDETEASILPPLLRTFQSISISNTETVHNVIANILSKQTITTNTDRQISYNPFMGLSSFGKNQSHLFHGRSKEVLDILDILSWRRPKNGFSISINEHLRYYTRWLQIDGSSGIGKSSLIFAGLLPEIERGGLCWREDITAWTVIDPIVPGAEPVERLAEAISKAVEPDPLKRDMASILARLRRPDSEHKSLAYLLRSLSVPKQGFILVIDQFEELYFLSQFAERIHFDQILASAIIDADCPLILITIIRSDFTHLIGEYLPNIAAHYNNLCSKYFLGPIGLDDIRQSILRRAAMGGIRADALTELVMHDVAGDAGALPLIENCFAGMWDIAKQSGEFSVKLYLENGGVAGSLSKHADHLIASINKEIKGAASDSFELLFALTNFNTDGNHTRRRLSWAECIEIAGNGDATRGMKIVAMLCGFTDSTSIYHQNSPKFRLLQIEHDRGENNDRPKSVTIIHEALIRNRHRLVSNSSPNTTLIEPYWPALYEFIDKNKSRSIIQQELFRKAKLWQESSFIKRGMYLATKREIKEYKIIRLGKNHWTDRYISRSKNKIRTRLIIFGLATMLFFNTILYILYEIILIPVIMAQYALHIKDWRNGGELPIPEVVSIPTPQQGISLELGCKIGRDIDATEDTRDCISKTVKVNKFCSIGKTEVSNIEYAAYLFDTRGAFSLFDMDEIAKKNGRPVGLANRGYDISMQFISETSPQFPITNINLPQVREYIEWLRGKTGRNFRLLTAEEWEIAVRLINGQDKYPWGNDSPYGHANCADCNWWSILFFPLKRSVRSYDIYGGLYNMYGNVYEWTSTISDEEIVKPGNEDDISYKIMGGAYTMPSKFLTIKDRSREAAI